MIAYKFLEPGAVSPFSRFRWPAGRWVDVARLDPCRSGIHACTVSQLPYWLSAELWEIELDGDVVAQARKVVATRARLVRRVDEWNVGTRYDFASDLLMRTRLLFGSVPVLAGYAADVERFRALGRTGLAAFAAARVAELNGGPAAYERERRRQATWLAARLALAPD